MFRRPGGAGGQAKFAADGQRLSGGAMGATASEMAYFDRNNGEWVALGGLGGVSDGNQQRMGDAPAMAPRWWGWPG